MGLGQLEGPWDAGFCTAVVGAGLDIHSLFIHSFKNRFLKHSPSAETWQAEVKGRCDGDGYKGRLRLPKGCSPLPTPVFTLPPFSPPGAPLKAPTVRAQCPPVPRQDRLCGQRCEGGQTQTAGPGTHHLTLPSPASPPPALPHTAPPHPCQPVLGKAKHLKHRPHRLSSGSPHSRGEETGPRVGACFAWDTQPVGGRTGTWVQMS